MAKLINVSDDVYDTLKSLKGKESYSVVIRRLLGNRSNKEKLLSFFGSRLVDEKEVASLKEGWKRWSEKYV
ncbi:MAG TPA: antitoxin VapB family protein [Candidatus Nanoarchaeia archaeon]|nr:antitoxin VapB family protein [Candidatus Nanoarchaeia archaeon]